MIRFTAICLITHFLLGSFSPDFFQAWKYIRPFTAEFESYFLMASTIVLPLLVAVKAFKSRATRIEMTDVLVDLAFALSWFLVFWGITLHALTHIFMI